MQTITLIGTEDVLRAASSMREAASQMQSAASSMQFAFETHHRFLEQWLADFRSVVESIPKPKE